MNDYYKKEYSWIMDREMEHAIFGDSGRLCVAFGPQNGHTYDFRNFGMIDTIAPWIEAGKLRVLCVDSIDEETWSAEGKNERERLELQERWFRYVTDELVPQYLGDERAITTGCSMGATHAMNFFARRPDLFGGQGAWEDEMRVDLQKLHEAFEGKGIPHWADYWGYDVNHDWPWWKKQLPYFMSNILGQP